MISNVMKVLKGTPKHVSRTGKLESFTYLMLNLPFICNYRCQKCFNLEYDIQSNTNDDSMSVDDRLRLIGDAKELGGKVVVFAGEGEPTLHPDIRRLVSKTNEIGMIPIVYSNGSTLSQDIVEFYRDNNVALVIAFDSLDELKYNQLTRTKNQFKKVLQNVNRVIDWFERPYFESGLEVYSVAINTTVSSINAGEVEQIKAYWGDKVYFICNPLARLGNARTHWTDLEVDEKQEDNHELIERLSESGGPLTLGIDGLCGYSAYGVAVSPSGDYITCAYTNQTNGLLGNISGMSLRDAFENKHQLEMEYYGRFGVQPCLVRSDSFLKYIEELMNIAK